MALESYIKLLPNLDGMIEGSEEHNHANEQIKLVTSYICDATNRIVQEIWQKHARKGQKTIRDKEIRAFLYALLEVNYISDKKLAKLYKVLDYD